MARLWTVIRREYLERVRSKWFVIATVFGPAIACASMGLYHVLRLRRRTVTLDLGVVARRVVRRRGAGRIGHGPVGGLRRAHGSERLGQDDAAEPHRGHRPAHGRHGGRRCGAGRRQQRASRPATAAPSTRGCRANPLGQAAQHGQAAAGARDIAAMMVIIGTIARSWMASPVESKRVDSSAEARPGALFIKTRPRSTTPSGASLRRLIDEGRLLSGQQLLREFARRRGPLGCASPRLTCTAGPRRSGCACPSDRVTGRPGSRSRSGARRTTCPSRGK